MKYAPIVMFVYNRVDHFEKTYRALAECKEAKESDLIIFSDGAKNKDGEKAVNEVRKAINLVKNSGNFKSVKIIESPVNKGLVKSIISGVTDVMKEYGKAIVVEDDCVCSPYFLNYINKGLSFYEDDKKIGSIAGYTPTLDFPEYFSDDMFAAYRFCSCTWASWADRWENVDWELKNIKEFYNPEKILKLNANGSDVFIRLYRQTKKSASSWAVRFGAHLVKNEQLTVYPKYSYIYNIGCDESGEHSKAEDASAMFVDLKNTIENPEFKALTVDKNIQKIMKKHYSYGFISNLKRAVATVLIVLIGRIKG